MSPDGKSIEGKDETMERLPNMRYVIAYTTTEGTELAIARFLTRLDAESFVKAMLFPENYRIEELES